MDNSQTANIAKTNNFIYGLNVVLYNHAALTLITGSVLQSFMLESGISEQQVASFVSVLQIVQAIIMLFCSGLIDRMKSLIKMTALMQLSTLPMYIVLVAFSIWSDTPVDLKYWCIMLIGIAVNIMISMNSITSYKLPFHIMDMRSYGRIVAFSGAAGSLCGMLISLSMTYSLARWDYFNVMGIIFAAGGISTILASFFMFSMKEIGSLPKNKNNGPRKNLFLYRPFYLLLIPNLLRGIGTGILGLAVMIGYYYDILDSATSSYLVVVTNIASVAGNYAFGLLAKNEGKREGILLVVSTTFLAILLPFMLVGKNLWIFLGVYALIYFLSLFMSNAVPVMVLRIVDYDTVGQYTAWRMMIHTSGTAIAGFICIPMLELFGGILTLAIAGMMMLICAVSYYIIEKQK
jgi:MFS family permease